MATFKAVVLTKREDGFYSVYIRIIHKRKITYVKTDKVVNDKGLVKGTKEIKDSFVLSSCMNQINEWVEKLNKIEINDWDVNKVKEYLLTSVHDICFSDFARSYIGSLSRKLQASSMEVYENVIRNLEAYSGTDKLMFSQLTVSFITAWIQTLDNKPTSRAFYPSFVKRVFVAAIRTYNDEQSGLILIKSNPFDKIQLDRKPAPHKRAITLEECRRLFAVCPKYPRQKMAVDVCKMIICLAGINMADLLKMKKTEYYDGILHYERRKTRTHRYDNAYIEMRVPDMLLPTLEKYFAPKDDPYLFVFHTYYNGNRSMDSNLGRYLKTVCKEYLNMEDDYYTPYTFRHTWATIAQNDIGANYAEIGFAMNHVSTHKITSGYVKPDFSRAWELNEKVVEKIFFTNDPSRRLQEYHAPVFEKVEETFELSADGYFMGEVVAHVDGKGYRNTDEIIQQLMDNIKNTVPKNCTIQIKVVNVTKNQTKYFERIRDIK